MSDKEIISTIKYIPDDRYVAAYHGVNVAYVSNLRNKITRRNAEVPKKIYTSRNTANTPVTIESDNKRYSDARDGSIALLRALHKFFESRLKEQGK